MRARGSGPEANVVARTGAAYWTNYRTRCGGSGFETADLGRVGDVRTSALQGARGADQPLDEASCCPGPSRHHERCCRQQLAAAFAQLSLATRSETGRVGAGGPDAERERLPPLVEGRMLDVDRKNLLLHSVQPGFPE